MSTNLPEILTPYARQRIISEILRQHVDIPETLLTKAFRVINEALDAVEIKFFAHRGLVRSTKEVIDHTTRLAAAKELLTLTQMLQRDREAPAENNAVAMEYDQTTGVLRLVVGGPAAPSTSMSIRSVPGVSRVYQKPSPDYVEGRALEQLEQLPPPRNYREDNVKRIVLEDIE